jgi:cytochrome P450
LIEKLIQTFHPMKDVKPGRPRPDWDPLSPEVQRDQRAAYDAMRRRCPVAYSEFMGWSLFRHEDVTRALHDHKTFSNAVSRHLSVPNGMDPPEHTAYRRVIEPYFSAERMAAFEPICRSLAGKLIAGLGARAEVEFATEAAWPFAVRAQCAFLGWPAALQKRLVRWTRQNHEATRAQDRRAMSELAREFEAVIDDLMETRLKAGAGPESNLTAVLMREKVWGRALSDEEVASILRNWTVGEIGTIAAAASILARQFAVNSALQRQLRAKPELLPPAIEEILRRHGPLVASRRIARRAVEIGGRKISAGDRVTLMWISANRDERVFAGPDAFRPARAPEKNLLYGAGIHACPGAPLARLELRVFTEELLARTGAISGVAGKEPELAVYPASGFSKLPLQLR